MHGDSMLERRNFINQVLPMYVNDKLLFILTPLLLFHFEAVDYFFFF